VVIIWWGPIYTYLPSPQYASVWNQAPPGQCSGSVFVVFNNSTLHVGIQGTALRGISPFLEERHLYNPVRDPTQYLYVKIIHIITI
jgi:hypothetical protein